VNSDLLSISTKEYPVSSLIWDWRIPNMWVRQQSHWDGRLLPHPLPELWPPKAQAHQERRHRRDVGREAAGRHFKSQIHTGIH